MRRPRGPGFACAGLSHGMVCTGFLHGSGCSTFALRLDCTVVLLLLCPMEIALVEEGVE